MKALSHPQHPRSLQHPRRSPTLFWPGGLSEHLHVFALLHSPPPRSLVICAVPLLKPAGGNPQARAAPGSGTGPRSRLQTRGAALHPAAPGLPRPLPITAAGCSLPGSGTQPRAAGALPPAVLAAGAISGHGSVLPGLLSAHAAQSIPQNNPLTAGLGAGMLAGGREVAAPLWLGRTSTEPVFSGASTRAHMERKAALCSCETSRPPTIASCAGPRLCILT